MIVVGFWFPFPALRVAFRTSYCITFASSVKNGIAGFGSTSWLDVFKWRTLASVSWQQWWSNQDFRTDCIRSEESQSALWGVGSFQASASYPLSSVPTWQMSSVLLEKLSCLSFRDQVINWIRDFLVGRTMKVIVKDAQSEAAEVRSGAPQGSVLGPVLFLLFINHRNNFSPVQIHSERQAESQLYVYTWGRTSRTGWPAPFANILSHGRISFFVTLYVIQYHYIGFKFLHGSAHGFETGYVVCTTYNPECGRHALYERLINFSHWEVFLLRYMKFYCETFI